ncbi:MAG: esterase FrsA [Acidimicrobiia bacterium]|nr:esterase FrsA [Acidimicrobiia bacterium]MDH3462260.1 esterase FrsA [Acidimicrobiia bacterium]
MTGPDLFDTLLRLHGAETLGREYVFVRLARMNIAGHIDYSEISRVLGEIGRRSDWFGAWMEASDRHSALAEAANQRQSWASAGDGYLRASLCAHWASLYATGSDKAAAHLRSIDLYQAGGEWFDPPSKRVEIPFDGDVIPGYIRRLPQDSPQPLVVMLGGADTNKEELHHWGTEFARRGLAVLAVDGPGQGELASRYGRLRMRFSEFHKSVSAVLTWGQDHLPNIDPAKIGVFGNSLGGYLAIDSALRDSRIAAVISNGGFCDAASKHQWPDGVFKAFASCLGIEDANEIRANLDAELDLSKVEGIHDPIALVIHGGREDLADEGESRRAAQLVDGTLLVVEDGWHTCTNRDHVIAPLMADWMKLALNKGIRQGFTEVHVRDERGYRALFDATAT